MRWRAKTLQVEEDCFRLPLSVSKSIVNTKQIYSLEVFFGDQHGEFLSTTGDCIKTLLSDFKRTTKRNEVR